MTSRDHFRRHQLSSIIYHEKNIRLVWYGPQSPSLAVAMVTAAMVTVAMVTAVMVYVVIVTVAMVTG